MTKRTIIAAAILCAAIFSLGFWLGRLSRPGGSEASHAAGPDSVGGRGALGKAAFAHSRPERLVGDAKARTEGLRDKSFLDELLKDGVLTEGLSPEDVRSYVEMNNNAAASLLAAFETSKDIQWLKKAAELHPEDPHVMFAVINFDAFPGQKREWIDRFKSASPDNALANYLSAATHMKAGRPEEALAEFVAAGGKSGFDDFTLHTIQSAEEMHAMAGRSLAEAKATAGVQQRLPHLQEMRDFAKKMVKLRQEKIQAGETAAADQISALGVQMGRHLSVGDGGHYLINELVGVAVERMFLEGLDPAADHPFLDRPVQDLQQELKDQVENIRTLGRNVDLSKMPEADVIAYFDRIKLYGEYETMKWFYDRGVER